MPRTPDRTPGPSVEEELQLENRTSDPTIEGAFRNVNGDLKAKDSQGVFNLRSGSGITENQHKTLKQLVHFIEEGPAEGFASGAYKEVIGGLFPTQIIWWESSSKNKKIVEKLIERSAGSATKIKPTPITWKIYDSDGSTVLATVEDDITYSGLLEVNRTRTIS